MLYGDLEADMEGDPDAERCLEIAAAAGHAPARFLLDALREERDGSSDSDASGDLGDFGHYYELGDLDEFGDPDPEEMQEIVEDLLQEAWSGDMDAQFNVAVVYSMGLGVPRNDEEALRWFRAAARQGNPTAMSNLGVMHYHGDGLPAPDHEEALRWFRAAVEQDDASGLHHLAGMYHEVSGARWWNRTPAREGCRAGSGRSGGMVSFGSRRGAPPRPAQSGQVVFCRRGD